MTKKKNFIYVFAISIDLNMSSNRLNQIEIETAYCIDQNKPRCKEAGERLIKLID